jgi:UDP-GlcNAc:undecaprenyl-phosphate GlcNAc-1-phosphate transferase
MTRFLLVHALLLGALAALSATLAWAMARWRLLMDAPNGRSSHVLPTPRGGGIGIVVAAMAAWIVFWNAGFASRQAGLPELGLALGAAIVAAAGLLDDRRAQPAWLKFGAQALASAIAIGCGLSIERLPLPWGGTLELGPVAGAALAFLWLAGLTNAFNFMDGLDGLAAATATIAATFLAICAHRAGAGPVAALAWALAAGSAGFLLLNWPPARIFMGDVGSQFLGFAFAGIGILLAREGGIAEGAGILVVPVLLANFLFDTALTAVQRWRRGERLWEAHREHLYQRLNRAGHGHRAVTLRVAGIVAACGVAATWIEGAASGWTCVAVALALQCAWLVAVRRWEQRAARG